MSVFEAFITSNITANNGFIEQSDRYAFDNAGESLKKYILLEKGELAYNHGASKLRPYGSCFALTTVEKARIPFVYHCFSAKNQNSEFLSIELNSDNVEKQLRRIVSSGARMDGLLNISFKEYSTVELSLPKTEEQDNISYCFRMFDNLITLHQREHRQKKNPFLNENRTPFREVIANAWEQRKLGEVGKAQSGVGFPDREQGGKTGVPFYKVSDMNNAGNEHEMCTANNYVSEAQCKKNGWTPITEISVVFAKVGAAIMLNRKRLVRISFLLDNNTMAYKFGTEWDIDFGKTLFERIDLTDLVQIGALPSYNATDVECVEISMPDKPEQHRIGVFFKQLDNLITLHQRGLIKIQGDKNGKKRSFRRIVQRLF